TEVRRLAHHRSRPLDSYNYMPRVSVSHDASRLVYNSNFDLQAILGYNADYADVYMMILSGSATPSTPAPPTPPASSPTQPASSSGPASTTTTRTEQNAAAVSYSGTWYPNNLPGQSGGSAVLAMDSGSRATFAFTGTAVRWIGYRDEWSGISNVYVDGQLK